MPAALPRVDPLHLADRRRPPLNQLRDALHGASEAVAGGLRQVGVGASENKRRAKFYRVTRASRRKLEKETREGEQTTVILGRFLSSVERNT